jgi:Ca2+-binding EF-hand superfamily protein
MVDSVDYLTRSNMKCAFKYFDTENQSRLNYQSLMRVFLRQGRRVVSEYVIDMLSEVGLKYEDNLYFEEFQDLMLQEKPTS